MRLVVAERCHSFASAAEALGRILVAASRRRSTRKRGGAGMTASEAAEALGMSARSAHDLWAYARSRLPREIGSD